MKQKTMDLILILLGVAVLIFTIVMIWLYLLTGSIPDTLCTCFFAACTGECGFMGWIKTAKTRYQKREWEKEEEVKHQQLIEQEKMLLQQQEGFEYDGN